MDISEYIYIQIQISSNRTQISLNRYPHLEQDIHMQISECCIWISMRISIYIWISIYGYPYIDINIHISMQILTNEIQQQKTLLSNQQVSGRFEPSLHSYYYESYSVRLVDVFSATFQDGIPPGSSPEGTHRNGRQAPQSDTNYKISAFCL